MLLYEYKVANERHPDQNFYWMEGYEQHLKRYISVSKKDLRSTFDFGRVSTNYLPDPWDDVGVIKTICVWGKRNCSRLRRLLRENGAQIEIKSECSQDERNALAQEAWRRLRHAHNLT